MPIAPHGHPFSAREVTLPGATRPSWFLGRVDREDEACNVHPIGALGIRIEKPDVNAEVLLIVIG